MRLPQLHTRGTRAWLWVVGLWVALTRVWLWVVLLWVALTRVWIWAAHTRDSGLAQGGPRGRAERSRGRRRTNLVLADEGEGGPKDGALMLAEKCLQTRERVDEGEGCRQGRGDLVLADGGEG